MYDGLDLYTLQLARSMDYDHNPPHTLDEEKENGRKKEYR